MITPKQTRFLSHVLAFVKAGGRLGYESVKHTPRAAKWMATTPGGIFTAGVGTGAYIGYKGGRKLQRAATGYATAGTRTNY